MSSRTDSLDVCCIVLAAGSGSRFGSDKRVACLPDGRRLLDATLASIPDIFTQRLLVLQQGEETLASTINQDWTVVHAQQAKLGMGLSLVAGLSAAAPCSGALIVLADMPLIRSETFLAVARALEPERIVVPRYKGARGNPVGIGATYFKELKRELKGLRRDRGARGLLEQYPEAILWLDCNDAGILRDIDVPGDLGNAATFLDPQE